MEAQTEAIQIEAIVAQELGKLGEELSGHRRAQAIKVIDLTSEIVADAIATGDEEAESSAIEYGAAMLASITSISASEAEQATRRLVSRVLLTAIRIGLSAAAAA